MAEKVLTLPAVLERVADARKQGLKIVTTNGCFDLLHLGHAEYLREARALGDRLVVGVNSDRSVRSLKGPRRPVNDETARARLLAALEAVNWVFVFDEPDPIRFINAIKPDIHAKGGDYQGRLLEQDAVEQHGGRVRLLGLLPGFSTTDLIGRIAGAYAGAVSLQPGQQP